MRSAFFAPLLLIALPFLASPAPAAVASAGALKPGAYQWLEQGPWDGPLYMIISIEKQMVHVYDGDRLVGMASVSTGMKGHRTPVGAYPVLQKRQWHRSNLYSNAPMPFMQRLTWDGIALHAGHNPGYPASHGCIRMPYAFARQLFAMTRVGTLVEVTAARLTAALRLDPLVANDPGAAIVTFTPGKRAYASSEALPPPAGEEDGEPMLEIDPAVFGMRMGR